MKPPYPPYRQPPYPPYRPYPAQNQQPYAPLPPRKHNHLIVYVIIIALLLVVAVGVGEYLYFSAKIPPIPVTISSPTPTPTPAPSIPTSGEYVDDTTFNNVSFILDYQTVKGTVLANLTEVYAACDYGIGLHVEYTTSQVDMVVEGTSITIQANFSYKYRQPVNGTVTLVGNYDTNEGFVLTSSQLMTTTSTSQQTITLVQYTNPPALSAIESKYQNSELKAVNC